MTVKRRDLKRMRMEDEKGEAETNEGGRENKYEGGGRGE